MTDAGSEFQTDGAAHRKERFAKSVRANGWRTTTVTTHFCVHPLEHPDIQAYSYTWPISVADYEDNTCSTNHSQTVCFTHSHIDCVSV